MVISSSAVVNVVAPTHRPAVQLFTSYAYRHSRDDDWTLQIKGRVTVSQIQSLRRQVVLGLLRQALKVREEETRTSLFQDRVSDFLRKTVASQQLVVQLGSSRHVLPAKSRRSGLFSGEIQLSARGMQLAVDQAGEGKDWLVYRASPLGSPEMVSDGHIQLIHPVGLSVITDIDDTIKETRVDHRKELLRNTFLRPFKAVEGMQDLYQSWQQCGTAFHYISSSPWQLYRPLQEFFGDVGFPEGSFHLRPLRLRDPAVMSLTGGRKRTKKKSIRALMRTFPFRRFLLVGDSVEKDPEIYGSIARKRPGQIAGIFIRTMPGKNVSHARIRRAFRQIPRELWHFFRDPEELVDIRLAEWSRPVLANRD